MSCVMIESARETGSRAFQIPRKECRARDRNRFREANQSDAADRIRGATPGGCIAQAIRTIFSSVPGIEEPRVKGSDALSAEMQRWRRLTNRVPLSLSRQSPEQVHKLSWSEFAQLFKAVIHTPVGPMRSRFHTCRFGPESDRSVEPREVRGTEAHNGT